MEYGRYYYTILSQYNSFGGKYYATDLRVLFGCSLLRICISRSAINQKLTPSSVVMPGLRW